MPRELKKWAKLLGTGYVTFGSESGYEIDFNNIFISVIVNLLPIPINAWLWKWATNAVVIALAKDVALKGMPEEVILSSEKQ